MNPNVEAPSNSQIFESKTASAGDGKAVLIGRQQSRARYRSCRGRRGEGVCGLVPPEWEGAVTHSPAHRRRIRQTGAWHTCRYKLYSLLHPSRMLPRDNHRSKLTGTPLARAPSMWVSMKSRLIIYALFLAGIVFLIHHNILLKHG